jgi:hypothetical protein
VQLTAKRIQDLLFADANLLWLVFCDTGDLYDGAPVIKLMEGLPWIGRGLKMVPGNAGHVRIAVHLDRLHSLGGIEIMATAEGCIVEAHNRVTRITERGKPEYTVEKYATNDLTAILPVWDRIVAELRRLDMIADEALAVSEIETGTHTADILDAYTEREKSALAEYLIAMELRRDLDWRKLSKIGFSKRTLNRLKNRALNDGGLVALVKQMRDDGQVRDDVEWFTAKIEKRRRPSKTAISGNQPSKTAISGNQSSDK